MKSRYLLRLSFLAAAMLTVADTMRADSTNRLVLNYINGQSVAILLSDMPVISFEADDMLINSSTTKLRCPINDIAEYSFEWEPVGAGVHGVKATAFQIQQDGDIITITTAESTLCIKLYNLQGSMLQNEQVDPINGTCILNTRYLAPGIYILSINGDSIKFIKE